MKLPAAVLALKLEELQRTDQKAENKPAETHVLFHENTGDEVEIQYNLACRIHKILTADENWEAKKIIKSHRKPLRQNNPRFFESVNTRIKQAVLPKIGPFKKEEDFKNRFFVRKGERELFEMIFNGGKYEDENTEWEWTNLDEVDDKTIIETINFRLNQVVGLISSKKKPVSFHEQMKTKLTSDKLFEILYPRIVNGDLETTLREEERFSFIALKTFERKVLPNLTFRMGPNKKGGSKALSLMTLLKEKYSRDNKTVTLQNILEAFRELKLLERNS